MELLRGINLLQLVGFDGPLPPGRVVHLLRQACGALAEAHAAGLIHRDIKPANLMVCVYGGIPDFLKVLDFGLVKDIGARRGAVPEAAAAMATGDAGLSQDGSLLGTPLYMAPEGMSDPAQVDVRADVFALGAVGYFLLTGASPFSGAHRARSLPDAAARTSTSAGGDLTASRPRPARRDDREMPFVPARRTAGVGRGAGSDAGGVRGGGPLEPRGRAGLVAGPGPDRARGGPRPAGGAGTGLEPGFRLPRQKLTFRRKPASAGRNRIGRQKRGPKC